jgi:hypothetical protein
VRCIHTSIPLLLAHLPVPENWMEMILIDLLKGDFGQLVCGLKLNCITFEIEVFILDSGLMVFPLRLRCLYYTEA